MDERYQQMIGVLAAKLGTTVEHLWGVLVRQALVSGTIHIFSCIALWAIARGLFVLFIRSKALTHDEKILGGVVAGVVSVIAVIYTLYSFSIIFTAFINPEYWALQEVIGSLR